MSNNIQLHKGDIPENLNLGNRIAIDGEFMGLNVRRDPLCLIQLSSGDSSAHIIQFDRKNYNSPNLIKILTADSQSNIKVYQIIENLFLILNNNDWLKKYIFWELDLLKVLGYDLELKNLVEKDIVDNKTIYFAASSTEKKYVPNFLIENDVEVNDLKTLLNGLKLVGDYLDKTILKPNNINYPNSRLLFINSLK